MATGIQDIERSYLYYKALLQRLDITINFQDENFDLVLNYKQKCYRLSRKESFGRFLNVSSKIVKHALKDTEFSG